MFHKMITRIVAAAVMLCVTIAGIPAFAAAFAQSTNTFSLIETNNGATFASEGSWELPSDKKVFPNDDLGDVHVYDGANGKFGKDSTDRCMYLWNDTEADISNVAAGNRYQYVRLVNKAQTNITSGQYQELSFSIAYSGTAGTKYMMLVMSPSTSAVDFFKINPDTSITVLGEKVDNVSIRQNTAAICIYKRG